jgi:hypothetical protein
MNANFFHGLRVALILIALASPVAAQTVIPVPSVDSVGVPARIRCSSDIEAKHADKIIFRLTGALTALNPANQVALNLIPRNTKLDIKVLDEPTTVADLEGKVISFLQAVDNAAARAVVVIDDVDYAIVCPVQIAP